MNIYKNTHGEINEIKDVLKNELTAIQKAREKNKYSCIFCGSGDGFHLYDKTNTFHCFKCGETGDVVKFKMQHDVVSYAAAIKDLATKYNLDIPKFKKTKKDIQKFYIQNKLNKFKKEKLDHLEKMKKTALSLKDIDRAFTIESLIDSLDVKTLESSNYSRYKATKKYKIDKYISEDIKGLEMAIEEANNGKKVLLLSPTGSGKTDLTIKQFKSNNLDTCFISPNAANVEQIINTYAVPGAYGEVSAEEVFNENNIKCYTWDKFSSLKEADLSGSIAVVDEIHQTFNDMYRKDKIKGLYNNLEKCKGRIDITATPNKLDLGIYDVIIEYKQKEQTKYNVKLYSSANDNQIVDIINKSKKFALLENNSKNLQYYKSAIDKEADIITSDLKDNSIAYDHIMRHSNISTFEGILNTSVIVAGVNIYDKDITDIVIVNEKDISTIKQYVARFRDLKEVNIHIFNTYEDVSNTYSLEWLIDKKINETKEALEGINYFNKMQLQKYSIDLKPLKLEEGNNFYYNNDSYEYKIDIPGTRNEIYTKYYRKADIISFKELLKEYFDEISIVDVAEEVNEDKMKFKQDLEVKEEEAKDQLKQYLDILVGANEILRGKISSKLYNYLILNELDEKKILAQLHKNNIVELLKIGKIKSFIDLYTKYVLENKFTYEFSWYLSGLGNKKRGKIFTQINGVVYRQIEKDYPELINNDLVEVRLHNLIISEFKPGVSYTKEHLELFIEMLTVVMPGLKLTVNKLGEIIKDTYLVEESRHNIGALHQVDTIFYKNIVPTWCKGKQIKINSIKEFKQINDIIIENEIDTTNEKCMNNIIAKRLQNILESPEAKIILNVHKVFVS